MYSIEQEKGKQRNPIRPESQKTSKNMKGMKIERRKTKELTWAYMTRRGALYYSQARLPQVNRPARSDIQAMDLRRREEMPIRLSFGSS